jgi:cytochrome P450
MVPTSDVDLYADDALLEPYGHYRELRDLGAVVRLERQDVLAVTRYAEARLVLADPETFCSGQGVGLNVFINEGGRGTTLMSDGDAHRRQRAVIGRPLTPKALAALRPEVQALADSLVDRVVARGSFDAVADLAEVIPSTWVPDLLGLPADGRDRLLSWGSASFDGLGPLNGRCEDAGPRLVEMAGYAIDVVARREFPAGSMAAGILEAADRGDIDAAQCAQLVIDYLGPSLDTTISAIGNAVWCFATHPEQWDALRRDPGRLLPAFNEVMRYESPVNGFSRVATRDAEVGGVAIPEGTRVLVLLACANRDERRWDRPDEFDIGRDSAGQLGFGHGLHQCVGMGLARLEAGAVLSALAARVEHIELGEPVRKLNNLIRAFGSLPVSVRAASSPPSR